MKYNSPIFKYPQLPTWLLVLLTGQICTSLSLKVIALRAPVLYRLIAFRVSNLISIFFVVTIPNYQSSSEAPCAVSEQTCFTVWRCYPYAKLPSWKITPDRLSKTAYSIYAHINLYIWRPTPPFATRGNVPCYGNRNPRIAFKSNWKILNSVSDMNFITQYLKI